MSTNDVLCPDLRSFFLVPGDGWTEAALPFVLTSPAASGTPDYFRDPNAGGRYGAGHREGGASL